MTMIVVLCQRVGSLLIMEESRESREVTSVRSTLVPPKKYLNFKSYERAQAEEFERLGLYARLLTDSQKEMN
jgi:hypothetical protein